MIIQPVRLDSSCIEQHNHHSVDCLKLLLLFLVLNGVQFPKNQQDSVVSLSRHYCNSFQKRAQAGAIAGAIARGSTAPQEQCRQPTSAAIGALSLCFRQQLVLPSRPAACSTRAASSGTRAQEPHRKVPGGQRVLVVPGRTPTPPLAPVPSTVRLLCKRQCHARSGPSVSIGPQA